MIICNWWSSADAKWKVADWPWADCQTVPEPAGCLKWGTTNLLWKNVLQQWARCDICYTWDNTDYRWVDADWIWSKCKEKFIPVVPIFQTLGIDAQTIDRTRFEHEPWNPYRAGEIQLVEVICKIDNKKYSEKKRKKKSNLSIYNIHSNLRSLDDVKVMIRPD